MMNIFDSILDTAERMIQSGVHALRDSVPRKLFEEMETLYTESMDKNAQLDDVFQRVCRELKKLHALDQFASHIGLKEIDLRVTDMTETTQAVEFTIDWDVDKAVEAFAALGITIKFPDEVANDDIVSDEAEKAMDSEPPTVGLATDPNHGPFNDDEPDDDDDLDVRDQYGSF